MSRDRSGRVVQFPGVAERRHRARKRAIEARSDESTQAVMNAEANVAQAAMEFLRWADETPDLSGLPEAALVLLDCAETLRRLYDPGH